MYDGRHKRFVRANVFFDTGSNKSYVSREFVEKIKPKHEGFEHVSYVSFGSKGKTLTRSVQLLHDLEISDNPPEAKSTQSVSTVDEEDVSQTEDILSTVGKTASPDASRPQVSIPKPKLAPTSRSGRTIKPRTKLDLWTWI